MTTTSVANAAETSAPPRVVGTDPDVAWQSVATATLANGVDLWAGYTGQDGKAATPPAGKVWIELEATGFDVYVRFSRTNTGTTTITSGSVIKAGAPAVRYYIEPNVKDKWLDFISPGGVGTIKWRVVSQIMERYRA